MTGEEEWKQQPRACKGEDLCTLLGHVLVWIDP